MKRISTCNVPEDEDNLVQTTLGGEFWASDVIMHKGHSRPWANRGSPGHGSPIGHEIIHEIWFTEKNTNFLRNKQLQKAKDSLISFVAVKL